MGVPRRSSLDPAGLAALVGAGTFVAHQIGYLADPEARAAHAYLAVVGPVVLLGAFAAAWGAAVRILRRAAGSAPSLVRLSALQVVLYLVMEITERLAGTSAGSLWSAPVAIGMLAQPVVAWAALFLLRAGRGVLVSLETTPRPTPMFGVIARRSWVADVATLMVPETLRLRGPPLG